ncbi:Dps family protein [Vibrio sp. PNB22_3_1]
MIEKNSVGMNKKDAEFESVHINVLLASLVVFYQNVRSLHWCVSGPNFIALHNSFAAVYSDAAERIDTLVKRVITLGCVPVLRYSDCLELSVIHEKGAAYSEQDCLASIIDDLGTLIVLFREGVDWAQSAKDYVTEGEYVAALKYYEEVLWQYSSTLPSHRTIKFRALD